MCPEQHGSLAALKRLRVACMERMSHHKAPPPEGGILFYLGKLRNKSAALAQK